MPLLCILDVYYKTKQLLVLLLNAMGCVRACVEVYLCIPVLESFCAQARSRASEHVRVLARMRACAWRQAESDLRQA